MRRNIFIKEIICSLNKNLFDTESKLFNLSYNLETGKIDRTKTTFAEAHCIHCLYELGYKKQAKDILSVIMKSKLFNKKKNLFRFSIRNKKIVNPDINSCSNLLMIYVLAKMGYKKEAKKIMNNLFKILFNKRKGLFGRSLRDRQLFVAQTNLWGVVALKSIGMKKEAKNLLKNIIKNFYDIERSCLVSKNSTKKGKYREKYIFADDNFLFCYIAKQEYPELCKKIVTNTISLLFDKEKNLFNRSLRLNDKFLNTDKSVYKNAICLLGLKAIKHPLAKKLERAIINQLYNQKKKLFWGGFSDSNLLACLAISK
jgi:tetratricopeptide (TPR) repeat protein